MTAEIVVLKVSKAQLEDSSGSCRQAGREGCTEGNQEGGASQDRLGGVTAIGIVDDMASR
jgi:hypothetical protein